MANDRGEVSDSPFQTEILNVSVGAGHSANVITDHPPSKIDQSIGDFLDVRKPDAVARRLADDVGREHERRAIAKADTGDANVIARRGVLRRQRGHRDTNRRSGSKGRRCVPISMANVMASLAKLPPQR